MKRILCGDLVPGCAFKAQAETEADVLLALSRHVRETHGIEVTPAFLERAKGRVQDVEPSKAGATTAAAHPG